LSIYKEFATLYAGGVYPEYSKRIAGILPSVLKRLKVSPTEVLDLACGEGTFATIMAKKGYEVTGVDQSSEMLRFARQKAKRSRTHVRFVRGDMRSLKFREEFDLVTSWYDALNYLVTLRDLERTFKGVYKALRSQGLFIFDMNTIYALEKLWQQFPCTVEQDTSEYFAVHRPSLDKKRLVATLKITGFIRRNGAWTRIDEDHREKGYSLAQIKKSLKAVGFNQLALCGSIRKMTRPRQDTRRVWFVAQRL
jgi:ubiquinone/menaquinone biosynthesis C-methylase UbiE